MAEVERNKSLDSVAKLVETMKANSSMNLESEIMLSSDRMANVQSSQLDSDSKIECIDEYESATGSFKATVKQTVIDLGPAKVVKESALPIDDGDTPRKNIDTE